MRLQHVILTAAMLCVLAAPALAKDAPTETLEATATRVRELEKANVVLQEDLGRARLQLDLAQSALNKTRADLDAEIRSRKALEELMAVKLAELGRAIEALSARHNADLQAIRQDCDLKITGLQKALGEETAARSELEKNTIRQIGRLDKRQQQDRLWGFVMNGLNLGVSLTR